MSLQAQYIKFKKNIALTRESIEYKDAREKDDQITPKIEQAFKDKGYEVHSNFLQGSLATHTGVIPLDGDYDIDRAIAITSGSSPSNPVEPKRIVKSVLSNHGFKDLDIKKPCVTADYKSKPLHIDFPIYRITIFDDYELAIGRENSNEDNRLWDDSDPKGLVGWITSNKNHQVFWNTLSSEEKHQFYRLVRYIKRWRDFKYTSEEQRKKVFSIALTVMFKESFKPNVDDNGKADDHQALKDTLETLLEENRYFFYDGNDEYSIRVNLPKTPNRDIFDGKGKSVGTTLKNLLIRLLNALKDADDKETLKEQCEILQGQFGDDFPVPEDNNSDKSSSSSSRQCSESAGIVGVSNGA